MFILYFLGVGPPCRSIFCQFWLCEEAQCVYLRLHLGSPVSDKFYHHVYLGGKGSAESHEWVFRVKWEDGGKGAGIKK